MIERRIIETKYYRKFIQSQNKTVVDKIQKAINILKQYRILPSNYVKYICEGIYELRVISGGNIFRIFFIFDAENIVVLMNGFQKKTNKTPNNEIAKAIKIKKEYYEGKC